MKPPFRPGQPPKPGAKPYKPTEEHRRQVMMMTGFGISQMEMCACLRISRPTLEKYFRHELDTGATEANMRVAQALYTNATKHMSVPAQIWWTKVRMGWKDASEVTLNGGDRPIMIVTGVVREADFSTTSEERQEIGVYTPTIGSAD
jgi:hypothetical protein